MADFKKIIPFVKKWEGGLSRNPSDTASKNPCPYQNPKTGLFGYHTNKGVTWETFQSSATSVGYDKNNYHLFFEMPDNIWEGIYKKRYWDKFALDTMKSQVFANVVLTWAWGSGVYGAEVQLAKFLRKNYNVDDSNITPLEMPKYFNQLIDKEKEVFDKLNETRADFFRAINQPVFLKGWLNRLEQFKEFNQSLLKKKL